MDPVNGLVHITRILRESFSERSSAFKKPEISTPASNANPAAGLGAKATVDEVKRKISERIKAISDGNNCGKKAAQIFVEVVMVSEFGDQLLQDPQFTALSKDVVNAMSENAAVWRQLQELLRDLG